METNPEVVFRKIPSLKFLYEISSDGRHFRNVKSKKEHRQFVCKGNDYYVVNCTVAGKQKQATVHSLVAECWLGPRPDRLVVDHIDRNKHNNHYSNLRYVSMLENNRNASADLIERHKEQGRTLNKGHHHTAGVKVLWGSEEFDSITDAARTLSVRLDKSYSTIYKYFQQRRKYVLGQSTRYYCRD